MVRKTRAQHWDDMYELPLSEIPWEITRPPKELLEALDAGEARGTKALDIACGTGNYTFYLAQHGFSEVVGVDFSEKALGMARQRNETLKLPVRFIMEDITKLTDVFKTEKFDFILDYSILHHLEHAVTTDYAQQCYRLLNPGGRVLLVCYSDKDVAGQHEIVGKYGNKMFYRSAAEIRVAYQDFTEVYYRESTLGKRGQHQAHCFLFEKA